MESIGKTVAIITAGGSGNRLPGKQKKQFRLLDGRPVLIITLDAFLSHPRIDSIIVTLPIEDMGYFSHLLEECYSEESPLDKVILCPGGNHRQDSVYNALQHCPARTETVLIHDGVRPFVSAELLSALIEQVHSDQAVIPVSPVKNTIKQVNGNLVVSTPARETLVQVYTPQAFAYSLIKQCYDLAREEGFYSTDDAALAEHYGYPVHTFTDTSANLKITDEQDLLIADFLLKHNSKKI